MAQTTTKKALIKIAEIISIILNPVLMVFVMILALSIRFDIPYLTIATIMAPFLITTTGYVIYHTYVIRDADLDLTQLKTRKYLGVTSFAGLMLTYAISNYLYPDLNEVFYRVGIVVLISGLISLKWKISFHAIGYSSLAFSFARLFGLHWLALILLLPVLYWARLTLKKHTIKQLIAGSLLSLVMLL
jgi:hypothetical protein